MNKKQITAILLGLSSCFAAYSQTTDTGIDTYNFDYKGVRYILEQYKTDGKAVIKTT